jgi:hypothetical protein
MRFKPKKLNTMKPPSLSSYAPVQPSHFYRSLTSENSTNICLLKVITPSLRSFDENAVRNLLIVAGIVQCKVIVATVPEIVRGAIQTP